jgi:PAS domain S-box-containing protein
MQAAGKRGVAMSSDKRLSETVRIDLTDAEGQPGASVTETPVSSLTRMHWQPRRKAPEYVARSRYQELLQSLYDAALVTSMSGEIIDVNARAVEFLRYERADLFVMKIFDIIYGSEDTLIETLTGNLDRERFSLIQAYCVRSDGTYFPAEVAVSRLRLDEVCLCFFIRDISWRVEAEDRLRLEHEALQIAGSAIAITNDEATLVFVNAAFGRLLGYENIESLAETNMLDYFVNREEGEAFVERVRSDDREWMIETHLRRHDGEDTYVQVTAVCNRSAEGKPTGVVFSFADLSEIERSRDQMRVEHAALERKVGEQEAEMAALREAAERQRQAEPVGTRGQ